MKRFLFGALAGTAFFACYAMNGAAAVGAADLVPARMGLPAPWGLLKAFLLLTFFIHIVLVNVLLGSSMLASINVWRGKPLIVHSLKNDAGFATGVLALTVNFGVIPFLFAQAAYGSFLYTSNLLMAIWWLSIPVLVMLAYYALYIIKTSAPGEDSRLRLVMSVNTLFLMLVAFFLSASSRMAAEPASWLGWLERPGGTMLYLGDPTLLPRYLHVLAASLAMGGLFMAVRARWRPRVPGADAARAETRVKYGLKVFIYASLAQALAGVWYLFSQPAPVRNLFLGQSLVATGAIVLVFLGLAAAIWTARSGMPGVTSGFALGIIFIMICVRDLVRDFTLSPYSQEAARRYADELLRGSAAADAELAPHLMRQAVELPLPIRDMQGAGFALFLVCAAIGLAALFWLLRVAVKTFNGAADIGDK